MKFDVIIVGSGPAGLGAAFHISENSNKKILLIDKESISVGGLRNDCKQNYLFPIGFSKEYWDEKNASELLEIVAQHLNPTYEKQNNIKKYVERAEKISVKLLEIKQAHVGTDKSKILITNLIEQLKNLNVDISLNTNCKEINYEKRTIIIENTKTQEEQEIEFEDLILAPGRAGFRWLQNYMNKLNIKYSDNIIDIGVRLEMHQKNYSIVNDYYDPKFIFPENVRTFCTNSGSAYIVKENYKDYYSINGHAYSQNQRTNNLVNFAVLKTIKLTDPVASGQEFAKILGQAAMNLGGGKPIMQRIGDFKFNKRSKRETFNEDLYDFKPTLPDCTPGDISLAVPAKILNSIWNSLELLDAIVPGVLSPSTIIYYPEIKTYANKPEFINEFFCVKPNIYTIGDGAGTSRGITAAWASGIRAANGILK